MTKAPPFESGLPGLEYTDLFDAAGLHRLDQAFLDDLQQRHADLHAWLLAWRDGSEAGDSRVSDNLLAIAAPLERFLARLFDIEPELAGGRNAVSLDNNVFAFRQEFVAKRARRYRQAIDESFAELDQAIDAELGRAGLANGDDRELRIAVWSTQLLAAEDADADAIALLVRWCAAVLQGSPGSEAVAAWSAFHLPARLDYGQLVPLQAVPDDPVGRRQVAVSELRQRDGFDLTDARMSARAVQGEVNYCVYCHDHEGDFCSRGFPEKKTAPDLGLKTNPLGDVLTGCPLEERISEMNLLKRDGFTIAPLAMAMAENPMLPATGHRICNDCMKACIYQKQEPVDIPQIETRCLTDVLALPWGVEIYDLLTRWNPLRQTQYVMQPYNGRKVLIAGQGPAGFTMAHYLTMAGCAVVAVDGLKIESLPAALLDTPIYRYSDLVESLDSRVLAGFGGVAEYGITVRWDKNFLKLVHLSLCRRRHYQVFGGIRLGGTLTIDNAWELGFDHVCLATGAGLPRVIPMGNSLARGMRQANDFLMALQLTGASRDESLANLQIRLPAVVIGGGLTAIDTATEIQVYYIRQVEKIARRYRTLVAASDEARVRQGLPEEDSLILDEYLGHAEAVSAERERAARAGEAPDFVGLLRQWGGVTIVYRRGLNESPAYLRNHEEVVQAMREGIYFAEGLEPIHAGVDTYGHVQNLLCRRMENRQGRWLATSEELTLPARAILVAAGAFPNTIYEREHEGTFKLEGDHFLPHIAHASGLQPVRVAGHCKADESGPFTSYDKQGHRVSFIGDSHPVFHGSVVKAIASAKKSYPAVVSALSGLPAGNAETRDSDYQAFRAHLSDLLVPRVARVNRSTPGLIELWVRAPMAARNFQPGQFFRLQTYERDAPLLSGTRMQIPLLTVSGAGVEGDLVRLMVFQGAPIPRLVDRLQEGDRVVLMGPNGEPTAGEFTQADTVLVIAGMWGAAVMLALGPVLRAQGKRVIYFGLYGSEQEILHRQELEAAADHVIWCTRTGPAVTPARAGDAALLGTDLVEMLGRYAQGQADAGSVDVDLHSVDGILVMGATGMLSSLRDAMQSGFDANFAPGVNVIGAVGSPMQCMLKGVCAQCLIWQIDPDTGKRTRAVFSCAMQDQPLFWIDLDNLTARLTQNRLTDRLTGQWLDTLL